MFDCLRQQYFISKEFFAFGVILLTMMACGTRESVVLPPENLLSRDSMASVLRDFHLLESGKTGHYFGTNLTTSGSQNLRKGILQKHKISEEEFIKNMNYYSNNPALLDSVYQDVILNLTDLQKSNR